jgi:hypothetical protein
MRCLLSASVSPLLVLKYHCETTPAPTRGCHGAY